MYKIFDNEKDANNMLDELLVWYKTVVENCHADKFSDYSKHPSMNLFAVQIPSSYDAGVVIDDAGNITLPDGCVEELSEDWHLNEGDLL